MRIYKEFFFEAAHFLPSAPPGHPNARVHGHSFRVRITIAGEPDGETGLVMHLEDVERALDHLPQGFRAVVVMVEIEGYSYAEVAAMLGIPIGTVRSRLSRARSMLQRALWRQGREAGLTTATSQPRRGA